MVISTHSPVLLAGSRIGEEKIIWSVLSERGMHFNKLTTEYSDDEIKEIGKLMGDPNFLAYFLAAQNEPLIFIEDGKSITVEKYISAGISVTKGLRGVSEISRFLEVFQSTPFIINNKIYFIIDSDKGKSEFSRFYDSQKADKSKGGFLRFKVKNSENIYLIFLPDDFAAESLFLEFNNHLEECISKIWDTTTWERNQLVPANLSSLGTLCRRSTVTTKDEAISLIKNHEDVKSLFWEKVKKFDYKINQAYISALKYLLS